MPTFPLFEGLREKALNNHPSRVYFLSPLEDGAFCCPSLSREEIDGWCLLPSSSVSREEMHLTHTITVVTNLLHKPVVTRQGFFKKEQEPISLCV